MAISRTATGQVALRLESPREKVMSAAGAAGCWAHAGTTRSKAAGTSSQRREKCRSRNLLRDRIVRHLLVCAVCSLLFSQLQYTRRLDVVLRRRTSTPSAIRLIEFDVKWAERFIQVTVLESCACHAQYREWSIRSW